MARSEPPVAMFPAEKTPASMLARTGAAGAAPYRYPLAAPAGCPVP